MTPQPASVSPSLQRFFFVGAALALAIAALVIGKDLLMPLAFAALLAFVLDPVVERLRRWHLPPALAVTLAVVLALAVLSATATLMGQQLIAVSRDLPTYQNTIKTKLKALRGFADHSPVVADATRVMDIIEEGLADPPAGGKPAPAPGTRPGASQGASAANRAVVVATPVPAEKPASSWRAIADWAAPVLVPLATTGFVIVLVAYLLAQRRELRDRLVRLTGGDIHHMAEVLDDAARRVSRYLSAHLLVNIGYGAPMALGLWWIGVPGAMLWGMLAVLLRFVPYLGPAIGALFPLTMAFAVDPGWSMVAWTLGLVLTLELISNNIVEPLAYGTSTGVSPVAVLASAVFWGLVWGPVGLVLATPLTVCLVVMGQHLGPLRFLHVMLGSGPAFDRPTQLYQRLISNDHDEAVDFSLKEAGDAADGAGDFYDRTAVPMLALAAAADNASPAQRHRVLAGTARVLQALEERHPPETHSPADSGPRVLCVGARNELDLLSAQMLAHTLRLQGHSAEALSAVRVSPEQLAKLDLRGVGSVVLCTFNSEPQTQAQLLARRLRRRRGGLHVVLAAWRASAELRWPGAVEALGVAALATSLLEAAARARTAEFTPEAALPPSAPPQRQAGAPAPASAPAMSIDQLRQQFQEQFQEQMARGAQRAVEVFGTPMASVCWRADDGSLQQAGAGTSAWALGGAAPAALPGTPLGWVLEHGQTLVLEDVARDPRFAAVPQPGLEAGGALAAQPLRGSGGQTLGVLALHDTRVRRFNADEQRLLTSMATELQELLEQALLAHRLRLAEASQPVPAPAPSATSYTPERPLPAAGAPCAA